MDNERHCDTESIEGISPAAALAKLRLILGEQGVDPEREHEEADEVLCDLLSGLGYTGVVALWRRVLKWYA